jgi:hypothetical protein
MNETVIDMFHQYYNECASDPICTSVAYSTAMTVSFFTLVKYLFCMFDRSNATTYSSSTTISSSCPSSPAGSSCPSSPECPCSPSSSYDSYEDNDTQYDIYYIPSTCGISN